MFRKITHADLLEVNKMGLDNPEKLWWFWQSPLLQMAFDMGRDGDNLAECEVVDAVRYGNVPRCGISHNYRDDRSEGGLSVAYIVGQEPQSETVWFRDRKEVAVRGILLDYTGSDGEPIILPIDCVDNYDA